MTARPRTTLTVLSTAAAIVALAAGAAALAAAPKNPKALVLQGSDFPAGAVKGPSYVVTGKANDYSVTYNFRVGSREEVVTSEVSVAKTAGAAAGVYKRTLGGYTGFKATVLHLPAYGDQQYADFNPTPARGQLIVRRGTVVWRLTVENCGPLSPSGCLGGVTPPKLKPAQALSELKKYARKQKARVGRG